MKKNIYIEWMHCISCETLLQREIDSLEWCNVNKISHTSGLLQLEIKNENDIKKVQNIIKKNWYVIADKKNDNKSKKIPKDRVMAIIISFLAVWVIALFLKQFNIYQYIPSMDEWSSVFIALLIWIIASISTCLAVTWGIIVWFTEYIDTTKWWVPRLKVQLLFHFGRILWFFILWWMLGLLWKIVNISSSFNTIFTLFVSIVLLYMWWYMLGILPNISKLGFYLPKSWTKNIHIQKNPMLAPIIWALTFFLPCWFTQSMQLVSIGTGSFRLWWATMAIFALGTLPVLLWVWLGLWYAKEKYTKRINIIVGTIIIYLSIFTLSNSLNLVRWLQLKDKESIVSSDAWNINNMDYVEITHSHNGFALDPFTIELEKWNNYKLIINPKENGIGCMSSMIIPRLDNHVYPIRKWKDIIFNLEDVKAGKYPVVCWSMWMVMWEIQIK